MKGRVILEISDFKIEIVLSSNLKNSFSKKVIAEVKLYNSSVENLFFAFRVLHTHFHGMGT